MTYFESNWAVVVPMANESAEFAPFVRLLEKVISGLGSGTVYFIVDGASKDNTLKLCQDQSARDARFITVWAPENRHLVDAYVRGFREAYERGHEIIVEMDAGMSHDPRAIPMFLRVLNEGNECAFGSRYINGGSNVDSPLKRRFFSRTGTLLAQVLLGARLHDMTSGFQGFRAAVVGDLLKAQLHSTTHFYQTEVRHLLRKRRIIEVPIHYRAPSPRISESALRNSLKVLFHYTRLRFLARSPII